MKLRPVSLAVLALVATIATAVNAQEVRRSYIVQLADKPVASYTGDVAGLPATKPATGKLDVSAADVQAYMAYLDQKQANVQATVANATILHQYNTVFNGFAALLTDDEVRALKKNSAVAAISVDEPRKLETTYTPAFLGLDKPGTGLWDKLGGKAAAGENVIIGIVDSGLWPENPAYADRVDANGRPTHDPSGTQVYGAPPADWKGACETGPGFTTEHCNNKVIGARFFDTSFKAQKKTPHYSDFASPRDALRGGSDAGNKGGHGVHTSTTAGGNAMVAANMGGIAVGDVSGVAPRARLAAYKVCWSYLDPAADDGSGVSNSCFTSDSVKAIETAVKDGVDVINFSISGSQTNVMDTVELAFFNAANAGVFVAASAGNSGPANSVAHISPWLTTVAASTHNRFMGASVTIPGAGTYNGASYNQTQLSGVPTVLARHVANVPYANMSTEDKAAVGLCFTDKDRADATFNPGGKITINSKLDPAKAAGKVVVCDRGVTARVDKGAAVLTAGGAGMILSDNGSGLVADLHVLPAIHVSAADGSAIKTWVNSHADATSSMTKAVASVGATLAPKMAGFSSRGPNKGDLNVLKPDLTAPGVDIIAAVSAPGNPALRAAIADGSVVPDAAWGSLQGTSMSSPHVAGLGALLRNLHPTWSPAAIKSALMTTAYGTYNDGVAGMSNGQLPWSQGAGHVQPNKAADPGLVYDSNAVDWIRYLCGIGKLAANSANCTNYGSIQPYNLNLASITIAEVLGKASITRTVTNVGDTTSTYTASASLPGYAVTVSPSTLTLAPGAKATFTVNLTNNSAPQGAWSYGSLTWNDGTHTVRSPLTAKAAMIAARAEVSSEATSGTQALSIGTGYTGAMTVKKAGLKAATRTSGTVGVDKTADSGVAACMAGGGSGVTSTLVTIPAGALAARFSLKDEDTSGFKAGASDDLDLFVLNSAGTMVGSSGTATSNELVTLTAPAAGTYRVCVLGYAPHNGSANYTLSSWVLNSTDTGGNFKATAPAIVYTGGTGTVVTSWSGLTAGKDYLGAVQLVGAGGTTATTLVSVDATNPLPAATAVKGTNAAN
ncbi:MAG: S8 family serine peptidase [Burkholderiaceae bacterium]|nr:S8 family serine peptidase [Burkholderiaceae bacterium]